MVNNDDYNPENDPKYAIDMANAEREYWRLRNQKGIVNPGSVGISRRPQDHVHTPLTFSVMNSRGEIEELAIPISNEAKLYRQYSELISLTKELDINVGVALKDIQSKRHVYESIMGREVREMPDLAFGRLFRDTYTQGQKFLTQKGEETSF